MLDQLERKVRHIQVYSKKVVSELLAGEYKSVFKGHGLEFDEVREYQPGDEIRAINWQITARGGRPFVNRFIEEREQTIYFVADISPSECFGSSTRSKFEITVELCALLGFAAAENNDKIGLLAFTDQIELFIAPSKGNQHVLRIISQLLARKPEGKGTNIAKALNYFGHLHSKKSIVFLISDFQDSGYENEVTILASRHDLIATAIYDPVEEALPDAGLITLSDPETGQTVTVDTSSAKIRSVFADHVSGRNFSLNDFFAKNNIDQIRVSSNQDIASELTRFFRAREKREQYG